MIPQFGPHWPPSSADWWNDLAQDAWIHPLPGPVRRMPKSDQRIFGAERPGDRPGECRNGHCGVDIGGEIWGELLAADAVAQGNRDCAFRRLLPNDVLVELRDDLTRRQLV
jgi:hypothetical protein